MNQKQKSDEIEIDLTALARVVWKHIGQVITAALFCGILALLGTMILIRPTYRSTFTAFVNNRNGGENAQSLQSGDISASQSLTYTYAAVMKSRPVLEAALRESGLSNKYEYEQVQKAISTSIEQNTQLVSLSVILRSAEESFRLADAISRVAPDFIADIVEGSSMKVVTNAILPTHRFGPNVKRNMLLGVFVGGLLMVAFVVLRDLTDTRVRSEQDLEDKFGLPIIGSIPNIQSAASSKNHYARYGNRRGA